MYIINLFLTLRINNILWSAYGQLSFPENVLRNSPYIKGTILEKVFFDTRFKPANDIFFVYSIDIVKIVIPWMREGVIRKFTESNHDESLAFLRDLIYTDDSMVAHAYNILKYGSLKELRRVFLHEYTTSDDNDKIPALPGYYDPYIDDLVELVVEAIRNKGSQYAQLFLPGENVPWKTILISMHLYI